MRSADNAGTARTAKAALLAALIIGGAPGCMAYRLNKVTGKIERHAPLRSLLSAVLPGVGQMVNEQQGKGALLLTVELVNHVTYWRVDAADRNDERYISVLALTRLWAATDAYDSSKVLNRTSPLQGPAEPEAAPAPASGTSWTPLFSIDPVGRRMTAGLSCRF